MKHYTKLILMSLIPLAIIILLFKKYPEILATDQGKISLISLTIILMAMILRIANSPVRINEFIVQLAMWALIAMLILIGYSYQSELKEFSARIKANVIPSYGEEQEDGSITFYASNNGHFLIDAILNDEVEVQFLFDTGASSLSLTSKDAVALGVDINSLVYNTPLSTANGMTWGARAVIAKVQIGSIIVYNVSTIISRDNNLETSLLGMSFLNKLKKFEVQDNKLTLTN